jgi:hypothetical protein
METRSATARKPKSSVAPWQVPPLEVAAGHERGEAVRLVIAPVAAFGNRCPAEFAAPDHGDARTPVEWLPLISRYAELCGMSQARPQCRSATARKMVCKNRPRVKLREFCIL